MPWKPTINLHRSRELRRRVLIPAQVRVNGMWSGTRILNLSSRGMMIRTLGAIPPGTEVQILCSNQLIQAMVMWRHGTCAGLRVNHRLPVEDLLSEGNGAAVRLPTETPAAAGRIGSKRRPDARLRGRLLQFAGLTLFASSLAVGAASIAQRAMARPLAAVEAALGQ